MKYIIISRHPAAVEFIRRNDIRFQSAPVLPTATADDVRGAIIAGNLPLHLAALAREVVAVEFAGAPPRGQEYGLPEMEAAGARLATYVVIPGRAAALEAALEGLGVPADEASLEALRDDTAALSAPDPHDDEETA